MTISSETLLCGCTAGAIFVRPCPEPAILQCSRCECPLCGKHGRPDPSGAMLCPECLVEARRESSDEADGDYGDDGGTGWSVGASRHSYGTAYASNGEDGAVDEEGLAPADDGAAPFADEDYAAFDAVSDYDKNADDGDGYDS